MSKKKKKKKKYRGFWLFVKLQIFLMILVAGAVGYYFFGGYGEQVSQLKQEADTFVRMSSADTFKQNQTSIVYDDNGETISKLKTEKDTYYLEYEAIPADAVAAIISIEDKKFYKHSGVDYKAIMRAAIAMVRNGKVTQGASTITQQLARNMFLTQEKTWQRKVEEIFIAQNLEKKYSKNEIIEFYLNNIYFGNGYYGIQAASKGYFNTEVANLDLSQLAFLCAIPNNPTLYDPTTNMDNTLKRRDRILDNMYEDEKITIGARNLAKAESIELNIPQSTVKNDYIETYAYYCATRALMQQQGFVFQEYFDTETQKNAYDEEYGEMYSQCQQQLYSGGYRVYTSLNVTMQEQLQQAIDNNLAEYTTTNEEGVYELQSSGVCIDNKTGYVKAIVGGRKQDFAGYTLNRAYQSFRQPGSSIKPLLVYTPSLERGYTPDSMVLDEPIEDGPSNAGGAYSGSITLRFAVEHSRNVIAWKLFDELTPQVGLEYLKTMHFSKLDPEDERLPSALGGFTNGASALEMAAGYATIENDGKYREPTCIVKITDADGTDIYTSQQEETEIYKENASRMMTDILTGVLTEGTGAGLGLGDMPAAAKTGTTNDNKDGWFVGYTPYYTTSIWVGYDMPQELPGLTGSSYPGNIWHEFMMNIHTGLAPLGFLPYTVVGDPVNEEGSVVPEEVPAEEIPVEEVPLEEVPVEEVPVEEVPVEDPAAQEPATEVPVPAEEPQTQPEVPTDAADNGGDNTNGGTDNEGVDQGGGNQGDNGGTETDTGEEEQEGGSGENPGEDVEFVVDEP